jgi:hypothetical protein
MRNFFYGICLTALVLFASQPAAASGTPSISGTTIPSSSEIVDLDLNVWTLSSGVAYANGTPTASSGIILLLCYGGIVYQENSSHLWWLWNTNTNKWTASVDPRVPSTGGTTIPAATQIIDSAHNVWTLSGGQAYDQGKPTPSSGVILMLYAKGIVYQENSNHLWFSWSGGAWHATSAPATPSVSGTTIPSATQIIDNGRNVWTLSGGKAYKNKALTPSSSVSALLFYGGNVYREDVNHAWWEWNDERWNSAASDPRVGPTLAYVASTATGGKYSVTVIDTATNKLKTTIPISFEAFYMAVSPDAKYVYVAGNAIGNYDRVAVIDTALEKVINVIQVRYDPQRAYDVQGIVVSPDGKRLYLVYAAYIDPSVMYPTFQTSIVKTIDIDANAVVGSVTLPDYDSSIAISSDGKKLYLSASVSCGCASQMNSAFIDVIDTASNSVATAIQFPEPPVNGYPVISGSGNSIFSTVLSPDNAGLYSNYFYYYGTDVSGGAVDEVAIFNPKTGAQTKSLPDVFLVQTFSPDSKHLYGVGLGGVGVLDTTTDVATTAVANVPGASGLAVTPDGNHLYITDPSTHSLLAANTEDYTVSASIPVPIDSSGAIVIVSAH